MNTNFQERIIAILQESPKGLTSKEIAERLGATEHDRCRTGEKPP
jgi:DNA-binding NarL/FixJ family response regulator